MSDLLICSSALIMLAAFAWVVSMMWLVIKVIFKKDRFTFRKTIAFASTSPEKAASPKKKFLIALAWPAYWAAVFYYAKEGLYEYIDKVVSMQMTKGDIFWLFTIAFTFYQYAGFLAYDGIPE